MLQSVKRNIQSINRWIATLGALFLIPLMLLTTGDVVGRDIFGHPIPGTFELSQYLLAIFILLGIAYSQQIKTHVGVSLFISKLPTTFQMLLKAVATILCLFISSILTWQGLVVGIEEKAVSDILRIPQFPFRLMVSVSAFLLCLELLIDFGDVLNKFLRRLP
jgi:TRAP-type C4-dicarboxylate transport system permease small subunit